MSKPPWLALEIAYINWYATYGELLSEVERERSIRVSFTQEKPTLHCFDPNNGYVLSEVNHKNVNGEANESVERKSQLTEELTVLSTVHGRARRELRDISKHDLKTVMKYGTKTKTWGWGGKPRWKFELDNTVYITDYSCRKEITCYKKAISIEPANITDAMIRNHEEAVRLLKEDPHIITTHSIIIIDQSASMKTCDVNCFRSRSDAAYGTLALDYIAEQLYSMGDEFFVDAVTIIEMNDSGSKFVEKEPLDWILFNKVLHRMSCAKPRSHGSYVESIELAEAIIQRDLKALDELDADDLPAFMLVLVSDGKPSDKLPEHEIRRKDAIVRLSQRLQSKLTVFGMGIGSLGSDFYQLSLLVDTAEEYGAKGQFNHAGLNAASLSTAFSSVATSMTTTRNELSSAKDVKQQQPKTEKSYVMKQKSIESIGKIPLWRHTHSVSRYLYRPELSYPWKKVPFFINECVGFEMEKNPFGKGAERLAHMFHEIKVNSFCCYEKVGSAMVAKESRKIEDEMSKENFHTSFCHVQHYAGEFAKLFNQAVKEAPLLRPSDDEVSEPPPIIFLKCSVYEYMSSGKLCGVLVEKYLPGKFTKFNSNNGFVLSNRARSGPTIDLVIGEVQLVDFVQAFSHWVYEYTHHTTLVCDLQGILDMEGKRPIFRLTDPAICSKDYKRNKYCYGKTDLGMRGIREFCRKHNCNDVCKGLMLPTMGKRNLSEGRKK